MILIEIVGIGILFVAYQFNFALLRSTDPNSLLKKFNATVHTCIMSCTVNWLSCSALAMHTHKKKRAEYCANARLSTVGGRRFWNTINGYTCIS